MSLRSGSGPGPGLVRSGGPVPVGPVPVGPVPVGPVPVGPVPGGPVPVGPVPVGPVPVGPVPPYRVGQSLNSWRNGPSVLSWALEVRENPFMSRKVLYSPSKSLKVIQIEGLERPLVFPNYISYDMEGF